MPEDPVTGVPLTAFPVDGNSTSPQQSVTTVVSAMMSALPADRQQVSGTLERSTRLLLTELLSQLIQDSDLRKIFYAISDLMLREVCVGCSCSLCILVRSAAVPNSNRNTLHYGSLQ